MTHPLLFVEDPLGEALGRRLLSHCGLGVGAVYSKGGNSYLKKIAPNLNRSAAHHPVVMITDRDTEANCPPSLIETWLKKEKRHENFLLRVAEMESESWLMADDIGLAEFLEIPRTGIPLNPDVLSDPKRSLLLAVRESKNRQIRADILPAEGSTAKIGPAYNTRLTTFVREHWSIERASQCPSVRRALAAFNGLLKRMRLITDPYSADPK